jgi:DNA-binding XRE family transcriptional regulator
MQKTKKDRLVSAGWQVGEAADFFELSAEGAAFVELKLALADYLRKIRAERGWTQSEVARRLRSSQSRVAKMEAADASVSLDLLVKSLLALGASRSDVGRAVAQPGSYGWDRGLVPTPS